MSKFAETEVKCPKCGQESKFTIWESINTELDTWMKEQVRDNSLFTFECKNCGKKMMVEYGFLYHQMEDHLLIFYAPTEDEAAQAEFILGEKSPLRKCYNPRSVMRIVRNRNQFREKLMIFDNSLDDRIIEVMKILYLITICEQENIEIDDAYFYVNSAGEWRLDLFRGNEFFNSCDVSPDMYHELEAYLKAVMPEISKSELVVDSEWVNEHIDYLDCLPI